MAEKADVKASRMQKGRKTINYLQKLKDEGTPIVQMCPGPRDQWWTTAAEMAGCDICRLTVPGDGSDPAMQIQLAPFWIKVVRNAAKLIHINFYMLLYSVIVRCDMLCCSLSEYKTFQQ